MGLVNISLKQDKHTNIFAFNEYNESKQQMQKYHSTYNKTKIVRIDRAVVGLHDSNRRSGANNQAAPLLAFTPAYHDTRRRWAV